MWTSSILDAVGKARYCRMQCARAVSFQPVSANTSEVNKVTLEMTLPLRMHPLHGLPTASRMRWSTLVDVLRTFTDTEDHRPHHRPAVSQRASAGEGGYISYHLRLILELPLLFALPLFFFRHRPLTLRQNSFPGLHALPLRWVPSKSGSCCNLVRKKPSDIRGNLNTDGRLREEERKVAP